MRSEFLKMVRALKNVDIGNDPNFSIIHALHVGFVSAGLQPEEASKVVGNLEVSVNQNFVNDKELFDETVDVFVTTVSNTKKEFDKIHPSLFWEKIKSPGLSIKYDY